MRSLFPRRRKCYPLAIVGLIVAALVYHPNNYYNNSSTTAVIENPHTEKAFFNKGHHGGGVLPSPTTNNHPSINKKNISYPLSALNLTSAEDSYRQGFWQRMEPVPLERWGTASNTTCIIQLNSSTKKLQDWNYRVPYVILIGAQKGGSTALAYYLYNHPHIVYLPTKELHYFDEDLDQNNTILTTGGIPAHTALRHYQQNVIGTIVPLEKLQFEPSTHILDATPNYLFASDRVPHRIFCVTPWVKLLALLRNPVDRAFSHYHMQFNRDLVNPHSRRGPVAVSFEDYVELDMRVLKETGVIQDWSLLDFETFSGSHQELEAWQTYTKLGLNAPIGRGLYALQLRHWLQAMDSYEKPRTDLLVLQSEVMKRESNATYAKVLDFLQLKPHQMQKYGWVHTTQYRTLGMNQETRAKLQAFYEPYNRQLEALLGSEWHGVWE